MIEGLLVGVSVEGLFEGRNVGLSEVVGNAEVGIVVLGDNDEGTSVRGTAVGAVVVGIAVGTTVVGL